MFPATIRWRLPLSYAAIALLTTLAIGLILLASLRNFYLRQELDYLHGNALAISQELEPFLAAEPPPPQALQAQLAGFAFLSQTRVRLSDPEGNLVADSGDPLDTDGTRSISISVEVAGVTRDYSQTIDRDMARVEEERTRASIRSQIVVGGHAVSRQVNETVVFAPGGEPGEVYAPFANGDGGLVSFLAASGTPYGFGLGAGSEAFSVRSPAVVMQPITGPDGRVLGHVELSQGPAYGRAVLASVAWGWALAGIVAVALAALTGWFMSQRLTAPLVALQQAAGQMAAGDLSARAAVGKADEIAQLGRAFNAMAQQVEETVLSLRQFVADAAHEVNTPLTAVRTNLELVAGQEEDSLRSRRIDRALAQVARLESLAQSLLDLSRLEAGNVATTAERIELGHLVTSLAAGYASRSEQADIDFSLTRVDEPLIVFGQALQLRQALHNVLDNALKFTAAGGQVALDLHREGETAVITVTDSGIGIPEADLAHLFRRFHRGRNAASFPGNGLGLAITKAITNRHRGRVQAVSSASGATFQIRLPCVTEPPPTPI